MKKHNLNFQSGFSILEVILAVALFLFFSIGVGQVINQGFNSNRLGGELAVANQFATEGLEAVRSIKNQSYTNLVDTTGTGLVKNGTTWAFGGINNTLAHSSSDNFTRVIQVSDVFRDGSGNIVPSGGTLDPNIKKITSTVSWNFNIAHPDSVSFSTYLSNWKESLNRGGILVYGDGGATTDTIRYRIWDGPSSSWGPVTSTADIDPTTTNKALRAARVYASSTRNEKILISRHYNGSSQFIYAQVYNGSTWGNVQLLSSWSSTSFLDVQNFDGTYLSNGSFVVIYSDNTSIPKSRIWNGTAWQTQTNLTDLGSGQIPTYIVATNRPNTSEVMVVFFTQASNTISQYFNGSNWSGITTHASASPNNSERMVDFAWSPQDFTRGGLVFTNRAEDKGIHIKIFTANGLGSGSWSGVADSSKDKKNVGAVAIVGRAGINEFQACYKNDNTSNIFCFKSDFTPTISNPTNQQITATTDNGIERSYHLSYETISTDPGIIVYSDNTTIPKLKKYNASTSTWDSSPTSISTSPLTLGIVKSVRVLPQDLSNDMMVLLTDANRNLYSVMWDGTNNVIYTSPSGKAFTAQGTNGSAVTEFWYDFAWDKF